MQHNQPVLCERCQRTVDVDSTRTLQQIDSRSLKADCTLSDGEGYPMNQLSEEKRRLRNYEDEITQIQQRLTVLEEEKRALEITVAKLRFALEIWPMLPIEIWRNIFAMVCAATPTVWYHDDSFGATLVMTPVVLSHVCSRWRTIVLNSPELWTNINIILNYLPQGADRLLRTIMKRSKGQLLDIHLTLNASRLPYHAVALLEALLESSSRWKALTLDVLNLEEVLEDRDPSLPHVTFPNLVSLMSHEDPGLIDDDWFCQALQRAPKLREVQMASLYPTYSLPYAQLTTLRLQPFSRDPDNDIMGALVELLSLCENLCHLILDFSSWDREWWEDIDSHPVVQLPCLRSLEIQGSTAVCLLISDDLLDVLFTSLRMPVLDTFDLQCYVPDEALSWPDSLLAMLDRSSLLRKLSLSFNGYDHPEFQLVDPLSKILQVTPELTHFKFRMCGPFPDSKRKSHTDELLFSFLSELKDTSKDPPLLPKLEYLSLLRDSDAVCYNFILAGLLEIAESRQAKTPLKTVQLQRRVGFGEPKSALAARSDLLKKIGGLRQDGVSVILEDLSWCDLETREGFGWT
ncbi:hypothetical protein L218DRAFT_901357 [Marasmius fiardii PR-910]|nr:hypothetical protein L218DRAFT_901357 [Marasmius fiardii PR-910]